MRHQVLAGLWVLLVASTAAAAEFPEAELVDVRKIWDAAPHNAYTDLVRHNGRWLCVFREGAGHVSHDGSIRVIASNDGREWKSLAHLTAPDPALPDLRDPKISRTPDGRLMLVAGAANRKKGETKHRTLAWCSADGRTWGDATPIGEVNRWLWRVTWHDGAAYTVGYGREGAERTGRLYRSADGRTFTPLVPRLFEAGYPNEATLRFMPDDTCLCLLRRDGKPHTAQLGSAAPPYKEWAWKDLGVRVGGPNVIRLPDGRLVAVTRRYEGGARTSVQWLDAEQGTLTECLRLPSGGDTSYAGLVAREGLLWISYYSSHEGKTSIYLARVRLPAANAKAAAKAAADRPAAPPPPLTLTWKDGILTVHGNHLPGGKVDILYLEAYCRPNSHTTDWVEHTVIKHRAECVSASADGREIRLRDTLADGVVVDHVITAERDAVDFRVTARNPTDTPSDAHWAQPCIRVGTFTGCGPDDTDDKYAYIRRSFVFQQGRLQWMPTDDWATEARYTPGQVWAAPGVKAADVNPRPLNPHRPTCGLIGCRSGDGRLLLATAWHPYQELFQGVIRCLHSDFRIGGLAPGETKHIRGKLYIVPNDMDALVARYRKDFPEHAALHAACSNDQGPSLSPLP